MYFHSKVKLHFDNKMLFKVFQTLMDGWIFYKIAINYFNAMGVVLIYFACY